MEMEFELTEIMEWRKQIFFDSTMAIFQNQLSEACALTHVSLKGAGGKLARMYWDWMLEYLELKKMATSFVMNWWRIVMNDSLADKMDPTETNSNEGMDVSLEFLKMTGDFDLERSEIKHHLKPSAK
jgi:hypothetical protein